MKQETGNWKFWVTGVVLQGVCAILLFPACSREAEEVTVRPPRRKSEVSVVSELTGAPGVAGAPAVPVPVCDVTGACSVAGADVSSAPPGPAAVEEKAPLRSEAEYRMELTQIAKTRNDKRGAMVRAREAVEARKVELQKTDPECAAFAAEIKDLRTRIEEKTEQMASLYPRDEEFVRLSAEAEAANQEAESARKAVNAAIAKRKWEIVGRQQ